MPHESTVLPVRALCAEQIRPDYDLIQKGLSQPWVFHWKLKNSSTPSIPENLSTSPFPASCRFAERRFAPFIAILPLPKAQSAGRVILQMHWFLSDLVGIKCVAYSCFLRTSFSKIQYRCSSDNLVHRVARSCQRSFLDRNMSSRLTNRGQSLWIRYRLLSHSLLFPIDFGDSHVFSKIQELEVKRKLSSLLDFNRCRNFPYLFRTGRPRRNNRLVYNIIAVDSQEALTTKTERFLF